MLPTCSSSIFPSLNLVSVEVSERAAFIRTLRAWVEESPPHEEDSRNCFATKLTKAFDTNSPSFYFHGNISCLPGCIGSLTTLQSLDLSGCENLISLPPEIGNLTALQWLNFCYCINLASLPPEIGKLSSLQELHLSWCRSLTSLPPEIGNLYALQNLHLTSRSLTSLPPEIGNLTALQWLDLSWCTSLTSLPPEIGNLQALRRLYLDGCKTLTSLPPETTTLEDLHHLERQGFVETFEKFLALIRQSDRYDYIQNESIGSESGVLQATGRFVKAFKERLIEKRLQNMQKELSKTHDAIASLREDQYTAETLKADERGLALPLIILECFVAEDARVHCLRLQQEREDRLDQANLL